MNMTVAIGLIIVALLAGVLLGFLLARQYMKKYFKENPPVNEEMLRIMMSSMGQKPSEAKIQQILRQMQKQGK
ncbi:MAG: YneF family protein [Streptococcaceae bacterium]|nr:YneF family protein [Streptococcaceae bacterium]